MVPLLVLRKISDTAAGVGDSPSTYHEEIEFGAEEEKEEERRIRIDAKRHEIDSLKRQKREAELQSEELKLQKE